MDNGVNQAGLPPQGVGVDFSGMPFNAASDEGLRVEFYMDTTPDVLLTDGGTIPKSHPRCPKLKADGIELMPHPEDKDLYVVAPQGRPMFTDVAFIRIMVPGDKDNIVERVARDSDKQRFPALWRRFQESGSAAETAGTPLAHWPPLTKALVRELAFFNVKTVEQLASVSDENLSKIGPFLKYRKQAQDWLAAAKGAGPVTALRAENDALRADLENLRRALKEQGDHIAELRKNRKQ